MVAGITVGLIAGLRKGKLFDASALVVSLILISLPIFVIAFVAQYIFGIQLGLVPNHGRTRCADRRT